MKVTILAAGSRGDVEPYVALGKGLHEAGHAVIVLASEDFADLIASHDLAFADMGGSVASVAGGMQDLLEGGNLLRVLAAMGPAAKRLANAATASGLEACDGATLILAGLGGLFGGVSLSEKLGVPLVPAYLYPFTPTDAFPSVLLPPTPLRLPPWANRLSHRVGQQMLWQAYRQADVQARRQVLNLSPPPFWGPFSSLERNRPILCGYSRHVVAVPHDWSPSIHVTGNWLLDPPADWKPPRDLDAFLRAGPPPIYIGFGSMVHRRPEETLQLIAQTLERCRQRAVVSVGSSGVRANHLPPSAIAIGPVPHSWLFPQMAAVVHHGGAGTTAAGFRAGVPSVITPYFGDQPFWARRAHELGVGPSPIPRRNLTADRLASAIQEAVSSERIRQRAIELSARMRSEDGVSRAVAILEEFGLGAAAGSAGATASRRL